MASEEFGKTDERFQIGTGLSFLGYLQQAKYKNESGWEKVLEDFNSTNTGGITILKRDSGGMQIADKKGNKYDLIPGTLPEKPD